MQDLDVFSSEKSLTQLWLKQCLVDSTLTRMTISVIRLWLDSYSGFSRPTRLWLAHLSQSRVNFDSRLRTLKLTHDANAPMSIRRLLSDRCEVSSRKTRATCNRELENTRVRTEFARRSFLYRATRAWNELPVTVMNSQSFSVFKANVGK